ncbi:hypothetical protein [Planosporangium sp. 12N6]|uniref:hypothetical protein n=1 Tax=Planosporangium spinosum TaxID=3402278 RepID=UPI003CF558B2
MTVIELADQPGACRLTVTHDLTGAPATAALTGGALEDTGAGGGWAWVLSDLKTLVETGSAFSAWPGRRREPWGATEPRVPPVFLQSRTVSSTG